MPGEALSPKHLRELMKVLSQSTLILFLLASGPLGVAQQPDPFPTPGEITNITGGAKPFFEIWDEDNVYGVLDVAMDGTVLMFSLQGDPHPDKRRGSKIYLK